MKRHKTCKVVIGQGKMKKPYHICFIIIIWSLFILQGCDPKVTETLPPWDSPDSTSPEPPTEQPTELPTELPTEPQTAEEQPDEELDVHVDVVFDNCSCSGTYQNATVLVTLNNGEAPFNFSGSGPVHPVNDKLVTFTIPVGSSFPLAITSNDNLTWETEENITTIPPYTCQAPTRCSSEDSTSSEDNSNETSCRDVEVENCKLVEVKKTVCTEWAGKSGNCKTWKDIVTNEEVCTSTKEVVCN